jgi:hypothetical protein
VGANTANETSTFLGVSLDGTLNPAQSSVSNALNATSIKTLRYGADWADQTNWSKGCYYDDDNMCGGLTNNVADFAKLCQWLPSDRCYLTVPAEIDDVSTLLYELKWLETTTGWLPTCWAIGNEPEDWTHFGIPWPSWSSGDASTPDAAQFAAVVQAYTDAIRHFEPNACIVGIEANSVVENAGSWVQAVVSAQPNVTELSIHAYPDGHCVGPHAPPLSLRNLTQIQYDFAEEAVPNASGIPVDVHEFSIGEGTSPACRYVDTASNAVFVSAVVAQALAGGDLQIGFFRFGWGGDVCTTHSATYDPVFCDYSYVLDHMDTARVYNVTSSGTTVGTWMVLGADDSGLNQSLLIANANQSNWENVSVGPAVPTGWNATTYCQSPYGVLTAQTLGSTGIVTLENQSTCVVQSASPCALTNCSVTKLGSAANEYGNDTVPSFTAPAHSLLYLAIQQDYASGNPPSVYVANQKVVWTLRSENGHSGDAAFWVYTAPVRNGGVSAQTFTIRAADGYYYSYLLIDLIGFAGFDPNVVPDTGYYATSTPDQSISASSDAIYLTFIGTESGGGNISPFSGEDVANGIVSAYGVSLVYGVFAPSTQTVGGSFDTTGITGSTAVWESIDSVDVVTTGTSSVSLVSSAHDQTGTYTVPTFSEGAYDLLYLAVADNVGNPTITDSSLTWNLCQGSDQEYTYTSVVPAGGISGHSFSIRAPSGDNFGYLLVDLRGFAGSDTNVSSIPSTSSYTDARSFSSTISTNSEAEFLAFVSTDGPTSLSDLTPDTGFQVLVPDFGAPNAVALVYASEVATSMTIGGSFSTSTTGTALYDAVDIPINATATLSKTESGGGILSSTTVGPFSASASDELFLAVAQDYHVVLGTVEPPVITDSVLTWTLVKLEGSSGTFGVWVYAAGVPTGGLSGHTFTIAAGDGVGHYLGYLLIDLHGYKGLDASILLPTGSLNSAQVASTTLVTNSQGANLGFVGTFDAGSGMAISPFAFESVLNPSGGSSYAVGLVYELTYAGSLEVGGIYSSDETSLMVSDACDV